jgi:hypothetical protein
LGSLETPESQARFVVVDGEDELTAIMNAPLAQWRVFLQGLPSPLYIARVGQQGHSRNVQAVCEFVRIKSSLVFAPAHICSTSVRRIRASSLQHSKSPSLRGWR